MSDPLARSNPRVKALAKLVAKAAHRRDTGLCVAEGPRPVEVALGTAEVQEVFVEEGHFPDLADHADRAGVPVSVVADGVLGRVLDAVTPQPVAAVVARPDRPVAEGLPLLLADAGVTGPVLVLAGVGDPGNVGTLLRSAAAAGATAVVVGPGTADPLGPKAVRASAGSVFTVPVLVGEPAEALALCADAGLATMAAVAHDRPGLGAVAHDAADLGGPCALVLGAEVAGVPEDLPVDTAVHIPQEGPAESLNVAMAGTVLLFEAARRRRVTHPPAAGE